MLCIKENHTDPFFNLATEEYLLKNFADDCFLLYINEPSVIVGKHQNVPAEINMDFISRKSIKVVRRISGGGTVYHDYGNLNYSFIANGHEGKLVDFRKFTAPITGFLQDLGVDAKFEGRNDLTIGGKKISGNSEHVWKKRTLHHGTLLYSSSLTDLSEALQPGSGRYASKAVQSVRSKVTNIIDHLPEPVDIYEFRDRIMDHIMKINPGSVVYRFNSRDMSEIIKLKNEKYNQWEWNFGYSPAYVFENTVNTKMGKLDIMLKVEKGFIREVKIIGKFLPDKDIRSVEGSLSGIRHVPGDILERLYSLKHGDFLRPIGIEDFVRSMF